MTKNERELILKAIHLIHGSNEGYDEGMSILCRLVGLSTKWDQLTVHSVGVPELLSMMGDKTIEIKKIQGRRKK